MDPISLMISILSLLVAAAALLVSWHTSRRQIQIEEVREQDRQTDRSKATLTVHIKKEPVTRGSRSEDQHYLVVENKGLSAARSIDLRVDGQSVHEHPCFLNPTEVGFVGPQSSFRYILVFTMGNPLPLRADITWQDDSGEKGEYRTALTL